MALKVLTNNGESNGQEHGKSNGNGAIMAL